jgi:hypothetical protein
MRYLIYKYVYMYIHIFIYSYICIYVHFESLGQYAMFDPNQKSDGLALTCGNHCALKVFYICTFLLFV